MKKTDFVKKYTISVINLAGFTLKMRNSKNRFIVRFPRLPTTYKPKIGMIHEEIHPVLRKNDLLNTHIFGCYFFRFLP